MVEHLTSIHATVDIADGSGDPYAATHAAMLARAPMILGGRIRTEDASLVGAPDILVLAADGYVPIEVKSHKVLTTNGRTVSVSKVNDLFDRTVDDDQRFRGHRKRDLLQLAHYVRILEDLGHAASERTVGLIALDDPTRCVWVDLDDDHDTILEAASYADEIIDVLQRGAVATGPVVAPWWRGECQGCPWRQVCREELEAKQDVTLLRDIGPHTREELRDLGITTIDGIAALPLDTELLPDPAAVCEARATIHGGLLARTERSTATPTAPIEVDFDIETYLGRTYLGGFLTTDSSGTRFDPVSDWTGSDDSDRATVTAIVERLLALPEEAVLFHWTGYERDKLAEAIDQYGIKTPGWSSIHEWFEDRAVDLHRWTKDNFVSPAGYSLKTIAPLCGFDWRDEDPGGMQSEIWFEQQLDGDAAARRRIVEYNEDDVRAQLAIRRHLINQPPPSVVTWPIATTT